MNAEEKWECGQCDQLYGDEDEAADCCMPPPATRVWVYGECGEVYGTRIEANECDFKAQTYPAPDGEG